MCEFCVKHGEGKKWYLNARNYGDDLLSDLRRQKLAKEFFWWIDSSYRKNFDKLRALPLNAPIIGPLLKGLIRRGFINRHWGQVIPIEDVEKILSFTNSIVRVPCICRKTATGKEIRSCFFVSMNPETLGMASLLDQSFFGGPDVARFEKLDAGRAIDFMKEEERKGAMHTVWTHGTPYVAAICNCDDTGCLAFRMYKHITPNFFRAEYIIEIKADKCVGCKKCVDICLFGALVFDPDSKKVKSDYRKCYGCGICRSVCKNNALELAGRKEHALASNLW